MKAIQNTGIKEGFFTAYTNKENKEIEKIADFMFKNFGVRNGKADVYLNADGIQMPDTDLRDYENVPLGEDIRTYFTREVLPHVSDAWISEDKKYCDHKDGKIGKVGYEISFTRYFYEYKPLRPLDEIGGEIKKLENEIAGMLTDLYL